MTYSQISTINRKHCCGVVDQMDSQRRIYSVYFSDTAQRLHEERRLNSRACCCLARYQAFFVQLVQALSQKPRNHSISSFVHAFHMQYPQLTCPSTPTVCRYIDQCLLPLDNTDLSMKLAIALVQLRTQIKYQ